MILEKLTYLKPTFAAALTGLSTAGSLLTWADFIKGWAGAIVVVISIPTGLCMLAYWALKAWREWKDLKK